MTVKMTILRGLAAIAAIVLLVLVLAGCGDTVAGLQEPAPGQTASGIGLVGQAAEVQAYLNQVKPIMVRVRATVSSLSASAEGMSAQPDSSWKATARKLEGVSAELTSEGDSLEAVTPPESLRSVHESAVDAVRGVGLLVDQAAGLLDKGSSLSGTENPLLEALVSALRSQVPKLGEQLRDATRGLEAPAPVGPSTGS